MSNAVHRLPNAPASVWGIAARRLTSGLVSGVAAALLLSACTITTAVSPPGKNTARLNNENMYCNRNAAVLPPADQEMSYANCMLGFGNTVTLRDGRTLTPAPYGPASVQRFAQAPSPPQSQPFTQPQPISPPPQMTPGPAAAPPTEQPPQPPQPTPQELEQQKIDARFAAKVDAIIAHDAEGWIMNKYDAGSAHDIRVTQRKGKVLELHAEYTYNRGNPGWVDINLRPKTPCLRYWDEQGECRPVTVTHVAEFNAMMEAAAKNRARSGVAQSQPRDDCTLNDWVFAPKVLPGGLAGMYLGNGCH